MGPWAGGGPCLWSWCCTRCSWSGPSTWTSGSASSNATTASESPAKSTFHGFHKKNFTRLFHCQVWSLSILEVSCQVGLESSLASLLMTSSMALANEGLFELIRCPLLTRAVLLSLVEITKEPAGCSPVKRPKLRINLVTF